MKEIACKLIVEPDHEYKDKETGEVRKFTSYSLQLPNGRVRINVGKYDRALFEFLLENIK